MKTKNPGLAAIVALFGIIGCSNGKNDFHSSEADGRKERVTIYASTRENSYFSPESFLLAEEFLKENTGIDFEFRYTDRNYFEENEVINHLDNFGLIVQESRERAEDVKRERVEGIDRIIGEIEGAIGKYQAVISDKNEFLEINKTLADARNLRQRITDDIDEEYETRVGETESRKGIVYLLENEYTEISRVPEIRTALLPEFKRKFENDEKALAEIADLEKWSQEHGEFIRKNAAKTIVHEIGHLFGLWHTHTYVDDSFGEYAENGMPNVMSYLGPEEGKYGFAFDKEQVEQIRDYFYKGNTYKEIRKLGFDTYEYANKKAEENGWNVSEERIN